MAAWPVGTVSDERCGDCGLALAVDAPLRCVCFKPAGATSAGWEQWIADFKAGRVMNENPVMSPLEYLRTSLAGEQAWGVGPDRVEYPEPSVTSSAGCEPSSWPAPVVSLAQECELAGWSVATAYARGCFPHGITGRPLAERASYSVRFSRGAWQGYAVYTGGAWKSIMVTGAALPPFGQMGRTELSVWLAQPDQGPAWYDEIRERRAAQKAAQREAAKARPKKAREGAR